MTLWSRDASPDSTVLVGSLDDDGTATWWTTPGAVPEPEAGAGIVELEYPDGSRRELAALVERRPHGEATNVFVTLPADHESAVALRFVHEGAVSPIEISRRLAGP